jgi:hypothetical protein
MKNQTFPSCKKLRILGGNVFCVVNDFFALAASGDTALNVVNFMIRHVLLYSGLLLILVAFAGSFYLQFNKGHPEKFQTPWTYKRLAYTVVVLAFVGGLLAFGPYCYVQSPARDFPGTTKPVDIKGIIVGSMCVISGFYLMSFASKYADKIEKPFTPRRVRYMGVLLIVIGGSLAVSCL